jgi:LacI family transcriptional regulator
LNSELLDAETGTLDRAIGITYNFFLWVNNDADKGMNIKYTIKDVSSAAGVSIATVSHVINNTKYVTEKTRKKVLDTIEHLNYKPNIGARNFKMGKRQTIGFVVPDISNSFFSILINEVERVVTKQGYVLIVVNTQENMERELKQIHKLSSGLVDGLIVASACPDFNFLKSGIPGGFPLLFIDRKPLNCTCDTVFISNYNAVYKSVENLIQNGHRGIGCFTGSQQLSTLHERLQAYRDCLSDHNIKINEDIIFKVDILKKDIHLDIEKFFSHDISSAVFLNNTLTMEAYFFVNNNSKLLDRNIEIVGYSEESWHKYALKKMDIITQPVEDMGNVAGKRILERIANPDVMANNIIFQANFMKRQED